MAHGRLPGESTYFNSLFMRTLTEFPLLTPPPLRLINFKSSKANENMGVGGGGGGGGSDETKTEYCVNRHSETRKFWYVLAF